MKEDITDNRVEKCTKKKKGRISTRCHILLYSLTAGELALHNELWISTDAIY